MSAIIQLLPNNIANQIAAGEVVQRPASVVKELVENAIDAGSSSIKVVIKDAGKTLIQVIDNGSGMSEVDARMSFEKHATSKIKTSEDLFKIQTMGFRGEAMASIAAVAQLEMETCLGSAQLGTKIVIEGAEIKSQTPVAAPQGTKISVKNLFFNVPARRNFLKSHAVETKHIVEELQRVALAQPDIAFSFYQNEQEIFQLPITKLSHRIVHLLGENYKQQLIPCQEATSSLKLHGYIGKPTQAKKTRGEQFFFVNQRFIKSPYLHHAVTRAFEGLLPQGAFPFYVLFIDIDPQRIDVNVHPTKTEIKFDDEKMVYAILTAAIKKALAVHHVTPSIDFEQNINFDPFSLNTTIAAPVSTHSSGGSGKFSEKRYTQFKTAGPPKQGPQNWEALFKHLDQTPEVAQPLATTTLQLSSAHDASDVGRGTLKVQLHKRYILTQVKSGILLIDQQAAHERVLYEQYLQPLQSQQARSSQQLLFPVHVALDSTDLALIQEHNQDLQALGFVLESFGKNSLVITGCPTEAVKQDQKQLLEELIEQFKWHQKELMLPPQENLARSLAKRACIQPGRTLQRAEIDALVDQLFACQNPNYTPDGRPTCLMLTLEDISKMLQA